MEEEKICPLNPHGNGYCKREKCALWLQYEKSDPECAIVHIALGLENIRFELSCIEVDMQ
jgi:hypothetical protein